MKRVIRNGVFETNSSSVHSMIISREDELFSVVKGSKTNIITAHFGEYYHGYEHLTTLQEKLDYLYTAMVVTIWDEEDLTKFKERRNILIELFAKKNLKLYFREFYLKRDVEYNNCCYEAVSETDNGEDWEGINIDHGGEWAEELNRLFENKRDLERLLFDDRAEIIVTSDSCDDAFYGTYQERKTPIQIYYKGN